MTKLSAAMPEASVLYSVTGVVVAGLVVWVAVVLAKAKQPWARPAPAELAAVDELPATPEGTLATPDVVIPPSQESDADETARQTPIALSAGREKAAEALPDSEK